MIDILEERLEASNITEIQRTKTFLQHIQKMKDQNKSLTNF